MPRKSHTVDEALTALSELDKELSRAIKAMAKLARGLPARIAKVERRLARLEGVRTRIGFEVVPGSGVEQVPEMEE